MTSYYCEAFDNTGKRIGSFEVKADTMSSALAKAAGNIEVCIRPTQYEIRVRVLDGPRPEPGTRLGFEAGWNARVEHEQHEWGPAPPDNPQAAFAAWLRRCEGGHTIAIAECEEKLPDGRACQRVNR
jgi:hypothetical protein